MLIDIIEATPLEGYHVRFRFEDGVVGELDLSAIIRLRASLPLSKASLASKNFACTRTWAPSVGRTGPTSILLSSMHV
jgi:hypothetical protein